MPLQSARVAHKNGNAKMRPTICAWRRGSAVAEKVLKVKSDIDQQHALDAVFGDHEKGMPRFPYILIKTRDLLSLEHLALCTERSGLR
eukprot:5730914-Amphidinium_carterae.4